MELLSDSVWLGLLWSPGLYVQDPGWLLHVRVWCFSGAGWAG